MAACDLTSGRSKGCKSGMGGLKNAFFTVDDLGVATYDVTDTDMIATWAGTAEFFEYALASDNNNAELGAYTSDPNNGNGYFAQTLNLQFNKLDAESHKEIKLLLFSSPKVVVEDYNGKFFIMGLENGMDSTGGTILTGGAPGDAQAYTLVMVGKELVPANFIDVTDLADAGASVTVSAATITP